MSASEFWPGEQPKAVPATGGVDTGEVDEGAVEDVVGAAVSEPSEDTEDFDEPGFDDPEEADEDDEDDAEDPATPDDPDDEPAEEAEPLLRLAGHAPGDLTVPDDIAVLEGAPLGGRRGVGIVAARFNGDVTNRLLESALAELERAGVGRTSSSPSWPSRAPSSFRSGRWRSRRPAATRPSSRSAASSAARPPTSTTSPARPPPGSSSRPSRPACPCRFGVLTVDTLEQAMARVDKGAEAVRTALEMADLFAHLRAQRANRPEPRFGYNPAPMSKICSVCGKKPGFGNHRSHSMVATKRRFDPNLQRVRVVLDGKAQRAYVCTRCLKAGKVQKAV